MDLPGGRGRLEVGAYEHGGIRGSGVVGDLELEARFGLRFHLRDEPRIDPESMFVPRNPLHVPYRGQNFPTAAWVSMRWR